MRHKVEKIRTFTYPASWKLIKLPPLSQWGEGVNSNVPSPSPLTGGQNEKASRGRRNRSLHTFSVLGESPLERLSYQIGGSTLMARVRAP
jgi:hypothetical protein